MRPAARHRRYGCLRLHVLLAEEGLVVNAKRIWRLYREEGLQVRRRKRRRIPRRDRLPLRAPDGPMRRWSLDFMSGQLSCGRRFRVLNMVDDCSRECPGQIVDLSNSGERLPRFLDDLAPKTGEGQIQPDCCSACEGAHSKTATPNNGHLKLS